MNELFLPDVMLRGATVGLLLLSAIVLIKSEDALCRNHFCALFALGTAGYTIDSSMMLEGHTGLFSSAVIFLSVMNAVFFWWCALAFLEDEFKISLWKILPMFFLLIIFGIRINVPGSQLCYAADSLEQLITIALALHVLWIAVSEHRDDLLEKRRQFRIIFILVIGISVATVATIRLILFGSPAPQWLMTLHAAELFVITLAFGVWLLQPQRQLFEEFSTPEQESPKLDMTMPDKIELAQLHKVMNTEFYTQDGLTISDLAEEVNIPEHRLRRLINQELGFRNFTAFLNSYRLADARQILSNPEYARRQITQIAFDLGYGSIAPFNRAFKATEGMTPTEYRRNALGT